MMRQIRPWRSRMHMHGLGLIELMIAVTIGLVLIAGALSVFVNSRQTYRTNQEFARMMESGNYALDQISQSVRLAGYWGKYNTGDQVRRRTGDPSFAQLYLSSPATTDCTAGWYADTERGVEGLNNTNAGYQNTCIPDNRYQADTDVLVVRHVDPTPLEAADLAANTVYIRADPNGAEMFVGTIPPGGFLASALNYELVTQAFYVSDYNLVAGDGQPTLKKAALVAGPEVYTPAIGTSQEIVVPGVEDMQIQYGVDTNNDGSANSFIDANNVTATQWDDIVAIRVWLLMRNSFEDPDYQNTSQYRMPDGLYTPNPVDGYRRLLVTRTIKMRNL